MAKAKIKFVTSIFFLVLLTVSRAGTQDLEEIETQSKVTEADQVQTEKDNLDKSDNNEEQVYGGQPLENLLGESSQTKKNSSFTAKQRPSIEVSGGSSQGEEIEQVRPNEQQPPTSTSTDSDVRREIYIKLNSQMAKILDQYDLDGPAKTCAEFRDRMGMLHVLVFEKGKSRENLDRIILQLETASMNEQKLCFSSDSETQSSFDQQANNQEITSNSGGEEMEDNESDKYFQLNSEVANKLAQFERPAKNCTDNKDRLETLIVLANNIGLSRDQQQLILGKILEAKTIEGQFCQSSSGIQENPEQISSQSERDQEAQTTNYFKVNSEIYETLKHYDLEGPAKNCDENQERIKKLEMFLDEKRLSNENLYKIYDQLSNSNNDRQEMCVNNSQATLSSDMQANHESNTSQAENEKEADTKYMELNSYLSKILDQYDHEGPTQNCGENMERTERLQMLISEFEINEENKDRMFLLLSKEINNNQYLCPRSFQTSTTSFTDIKANQGDISRHEEKNEMEVKTQQMQMNSEIEKLLGQFAHEGLASTCNENRERMEGLKIMAKYEIGVNAENQRNISRHLKSAMDNDMYVCSVDSHDQVKRHHDEDETYEKTRSIEQSPQNAIIDTVKSKFKDAFSEVSNYFAEDQTGSADSQPSQTPVQDYLYDKYNSIPVFKQGTVNLEYTLPYSATSYKWRVANVFKSPQYLLPSDLAVFSEQVTHLRQDYQKNGIFTLDAQNVELENKIMTFGSIQNQFVEPHDQIVSVIEKALLKKQLDTQLKLNERYEKQKKEVIKNTSPSTYAKQVSALYKQRTEALTTVTKRPEYNQLLNADLDKEVSKAESFTNKLLGKKGSKRVLFDILGNLDKIEQVHVVAQDMGLSSLPVEEIDKLVDANTQYQQMLKAKGSEALNDLAAKRIDPMVPKSLDEAEKFTDVNIPKVSSGLYGASDLLQPIIDQYDKEIFERLDGVTVFMNRATRQFFRIEQLYNQTISAEDKRELLTKVKLPDNGQSVRLDSSMFLAGFTYRMEVTGLDSNGDYAVKQIFYFQVGSETTPKQSKELFKIEVNEALRSSEELKLCSPTIKPGQTVTVTIGPLMLLHSDDQCYQKEFLKYNSAGVTQVKKDLTIDEKSCTSVTTPEVEYKQLWYIRLESAGTFQSEYFILNPQLKEETIVDGNLDQIVAQAREDIVKHSIDEAEGEASIDSDEQEYVVKKDIDYDIKAAQAKANLQTVLLWMLNTDLAAKSGIKTCSPTGSLYAALKAEDVSQLLKSAMQQALPICINDCFGQGECKKYSHNGGVMNRCRCNAGFSGEFCQFDSMKIKKLNQKVKTTLGQLEALQLTSCAERTKVYNVLDDLTDQDGLDVQANSKVMSLLAKQMDTDAPLCEDGDPKTITRLMSKQIEKSRTNKAAVRETLVSMYKGLTQFMNETKKEQLDINEANMVGRIAKLSSSQNTLEVSTPLVNPITNTMLTIPKVQLPGNLEQFAATYARAMLVQCSNSQLTGCDGGPVLEVTLQTANGSDIKTVQFASGNVTLTMPIYDWNMTKEQAELQWWDETKSTMRSDGCELLSVGNGSATANCTHLTQFAITKKSNLTPYRLTDLTGQSNQAFLVSMLIVIGLMFLE